MHSKSTPANLGNDIIDVAKGRVCTGPVPDWVIEHSYSSQFNPVERAPITYLLLSTQVNAESNECCVRNAVRLETMDAVQHFSQWRLPFEPKTQLVTLHSLKIRRDNVEIDHCDLEKAHFLQREEGLEKLVILGWVSLLFILNDVRPGDILEYSYTIRTSPLLLQDNISFFFSLPGAVSVSGYYFSVRFNVSRKLKWKSSDPAMIPKESSSCEFVSLCWNGEKYVGAKPELHTPSWYLAHPWIQVSDIPDWKTVAKAIHNSWCTSGEEAVSGMISEIEAAESSLLERIEKAIRLVQDDHRYLSVNLELGGQVPNSPEVVIQRRFGDCKDLSWLLVNILRKLGVPARPVLVNSSLRKAIADMLPGPALFNHVVVEFEVEQKKRWVDTTIKLQGGGPLNRAVADFGCGLPIDCETDSLISPPELPGKSSRVELQEKILLDTRGGASRLAVIHGASGNQADALRQQLANCGLDEMARLRLQSLNGRFRDAKRTGTLKYRDDRERNEFVIAESFEFFPLVNANPNQNVCRFGVPAHWIQGFVAMPEKSGRKSPFGLPYPFRISHLVTIESPAIQQITITEPRARFANEFVEFSRLENSGREFVQSNFILEIKADSVPAAQVADHAKLVEDIWRAANREVSLPKGYAAPLKTREFGELPPLAEDGSSITALVASREELAKAAAKNRPAFIPAQRRYSSRRQQGVPLPVSLLIRLAIPVAIALLFILSHLFH